MGAHLESHEPYVCAACVAGVRRCIGDILTAAGLLPGEVVDGNRGASLEPRRGGEPGAPGGDALVALAGGNVAADDPDALDGDPESVAAVLASWEGVFRRLLGYPDVARGGDAVASARWLTEHLGDCAMVPPVRSARIDGDGVFVELEATGSGHAFAGMAAHLRALRGRLEGITRSGWRPAYAGAGCLSCGEDELVWGQDDPDPCTHGPRPLYPEMPPYPGRRWDLDRDEREQRHAEAVRAWVTVRDRLVAAWRVEVARWEQAHLACDVEGQVRAGHDQGGRRDVAYCRGCGREYTRESYMLALRARLEQNQRQRKVGRAS